MRQIDGRNLLPACGQDRALLLKQLEPKFAREFSTQKGAKRTQSGKFEPRLPRGAGGAITAIRAPHLRLHSDLARVLRIGEQRQMHAGLHQRLVALAMQVCFPVSRDTCPAYTKIPIR